jgi:hypothetical protein
VQQSLWDAYASGLVVNIAIGFTILELMALLAWRRMTGRGLAPQDYVLNLLSGLCLMLALRSALFAFWAGVALCLIAAGVAHLSDLVLRARRKCPG